MTALVMHMNIELLEMNSYWNYSQASFLTRDFSSFTDYSVDIKF